MNTEITVVAALAVINFAWAIYCNVRNARTIRALETEIAEHWRVAVTQRETRLQDVEQREARFRQALGYYADPMTWKGGDKQHSPAFKDRGRVAELALTHEERYAAFVASVESVRKWI